MTFDDIIQHLQKLADGLEVKTITLDHRERMLLGNMVIDSHENIDELRYHNLKLLKKLLNQLQLEATDSIDSLSPVKHCTLLYHTIHEGHVELGMILLDHGAIPTIPTDGPIKEDALMLAARLHRLDFLEAFHSMVVQVAAADREDAANPEKASQPKVKAYHDQAAQPVPEKKSSRETQAKDDENFSEAVYVQASANANADAANMRVPTRHELAAADLLPVTEYLLSHEKIKALVPHAASTMVAETNVLTHYKDIVEKLSTAQKQKVAESKTEQTRQYLSDQQIHFLETKYQYYKNFFKAYTGHFRIANNEIALRAAMPDKPSLAVFPNQACKDYAILPEDREVMAAALALLKEYADFTIWHFKRGYRDRAERLVKPYLEDGMQIATTNDFLNLYQKIKAELEKISKCYHHGTVKNNFFNSSYYRRLNFIVSQLEQTELLLSADKLHAYKKTLEFRNAAANLVAPPVVFVEEPVVVPPLPKLTVNEALLQLTDKCRALFNRNIEVRDFTRELQQLMQDVDQLYQANTKDFIGFGHRGDKPYKLAQLKITLLENAFFRAWELSWGMGALMSYQHIENVQAAKRVYLNLIKDYLNSSHNSLRLVKKLEMLIQSNPNSLLTCNKTNPVSFFKAKPIEVVPEVERCIRDAYATCQRQQQESRMSTNKR